MIGVSYSQQAFLADNLNSDGSTTSHRPPPTNMLLHASDIMSDLMQRSRCSHTFVRFYGIYSMVFMTSIVS